MKPQWPPRSIFDTCTQALHFSGKNVRLSSLPSSKTFLKTTEHSWTKTILSKGGRRKLFNSSLMNELIRIEWVSERVSEWASAIRLATTLLDVNIHEQKWYSGSIKQDLRSRLCSPGGYLTKFNTGRLRPEVQPLTLSYTILAEKLPFLYTFYWKKVSLSHTYFRRSCSHFHVVLNK